MVTTTQKEEAELELAGARSRLARVLHELELFHGHRDGDEYAWLLIELDEANKQVTKAREKIRLAKAVDSETQREQDEHADELVFIGAMMLLAAKRGR